MPHALFTTKVFRALPEGFQGALEYFLKPAAAFGYGALNNQRVRTRIFERIIAECNVGQIIETGTFRGTTTELFAKTGMPVHSIEVGAKYYQYSKLRLRRFKNVTLYFGSSVLHLSKICALLRNVNRPTFVYLDAHWFTYLPLKDEVETLSKALPNSILMIDDFAVPGDTGFGFDDYGPGQCLSLEYLATAKGSANLYTYFPSAPSSEESGQRRGTCVATFAKEIHERLTKIELLKFHKMIPLGR